MTKLPAVLSQAYNALVQADNFVFRLGGHGALCVQLASARDAVRSVLIDAQTKRFTVLLLRPDYVADNYGEDNFMWQGIAADSTNALALARAAALEADSMTTDPADYRCLVLLAGIHDDINPELGQ